MIRGRSVRRGNPRGGREGEGEGEDARLGGGEEEGPAAAAAAAAGGITPASTRKTSARKNPGRTPKAEVEAAAPTRATRATRARGRGAV